jgi:death-on-curing protein
MGQAPKWVRRDAVLIFHDQQIEEHGGPTGLLDPSKLESALARPENYRNYSDPQPDLAHLAAVYACGICQAHPFVDGNKRTAAVTAITFLLLNGRDFDPPEHELLAVMMSIAAGEMDEQEVTGWIRVHLSK